MANRLKMANALSIRMLYQQGWSQRRIARELGVDRATVKRHLGPSPDASAASASREDPNAAKAPVGSREAAGDSNAATSAKAPVGSVPAPWSPGSTEAASPGERAHAPPLPVTSRSACAPFRERILEGISQGLSAQRIHQDLVDDHDFAATYDSVRRFIQKLCSKQPLPFRRIECQPAHEAQIDFGTGAPLVTSEGQRRRTHVLRIVLSYSRKGYSQAVFRQSTDDLIDCLENAFWHFGGVPRTIVVDNLRAAVNKADWFDPEITPKMRSFCEHYGVAILPTRPRTPRHKGKVERGVDYVQENALKGRRFETLQQQNEHLLHWESTVADTRIHGTTRKQVGAEFREVERPELKPLPIDRFPLFQEQKRSVHRDGHVEVCRAYYSVPPEYLGHQLWVRWDARMVRVFNSEMQLICSHVRQPIGKFATLPEHIRSEKISGVEHGLDWWLRKACMLGPDVKRWSEALVVERGIESLRVLQGLVSLTKKHPMRAIDAACRIASSYGSYRLKTIRKLIDEGGDEQRAFEFLEEHEIIRKMSDYGELVRHSISKEGFA